MNETWTDWLIQCDMLQDTTYFPALDWLYALPPSLNLVISHRKASRTTSRFAAEYKSWCQSTSNDKSGSASKGRMKSTMRARLRRCFSIYE